MPAGALSGVHPQMKQFEKLLTTPEPPELGPGPRAGVQPQAALNRALETGEKPELL